MSVKLIAAVEVLGALGLILPVLLKRYLFLVPLAALGLGLTMVGAMITHIGRGEPIWINLGLLALSLGVAYLRKDWFRGVKA